jgi:hypothetical protein
MQAAVLFFLIPQDNGKLVITMLHASERDVPWKANA